MKNEKGYKRKLVVGLVLALALVLTAAGSLAAEPGSWGLTDWLSRRESGQEVPTTMTLTHGDTNHRVAALQLRELTTDGYGVYLSLAVTPKEEGVLILNSHVIPYETSAAQIGLEADTPEQTVAEWAAAHGYRKLYQLNLYGDAHSTYNPMRIESDGTSLFMLSGEYKGEGYIYNIRYKISTFPDETTYWQIFSDDGNGTIAERDDSIEKAICFTVAPPKDMQPEILAEYLPAPGQEQPKEYPEVTGVKVLCTPLAVYYDVAYTHPAAGDKKENTFGKPGFFELQFFNREVWMGGWYIETLPDGSVQYHELNSCHLPQPLPEQLSLECSINHTDSDLGDYIGIVYSHVTLNRQ